MEDILYDNTTKDEYAVNGDVASGECTAQNQECIIVPGKSEYKLYLDVGVGAFCYLNDEGPDDLFREIRKELVKDGMNVVNISLTGNGNINVQANY